MELGTSTHALRAHAAILHAFIPRSVRIPAPCQAVRFAFTTSSLLVLQAVGSSLTFVEC